jgi:hypothetical protein
MALVATSILSPRFVPDGSVLLHRQFDTSHPDSKLWQIQCRALEEAGFQSACTYLPLE